MLNRQVMFIRFILPAVMLLSAVSTRAQKTEHRDIKPFNRIECKGSLKVIYRHSDTLGLQVKGDADEIDDIKTSVENGVLRLINQGKLQEDVVIIVSHNQLTALETEGATEFRSANTIKGGSFEMKAGGASNADLSLDMSSVHVQVGGAASAQLQGTTQSLEAAVTGAANLKAYRLISTSVDVETSGAANARVYAREKFHGVATGASSIKLKGEPKDMIAEASSAASISRVNDDTKKGVDTVTYHWREKKVTVIEDGDKQEIVIHKSLGRGESERVTRKFKHWRGFSFGVNGYMQDGSTILPRDLAFLDLDYGRSFNYQLNFIERHFNLVGHHLKIITGMGVDWHRYEFLHNSNLDSDTTYTWGTITNDPVIRYKKNRLRTTYLQVPLLLEMNTSNNFTRTFHIAVGVIGQYLIFHSTKQVYDDGSDLKRVNKSNYNLSAFAAKAHVNFGYRGWTIYAEYSLTTLFKPTMGPELYPFAAGLRVIPFS